ncbi:MBL fold metallo-hydrolase [Carboxydocella sp. ULO1]|uniref:MBL fold metallo-hydrolase n=1 Tax=Carboxydocella sp. ULO1 TaxID=1926599 RepID=UPI0009AC6585|nr:MBL fold metallo-hydrolase [Carboxydocella sp. ULO1]GAW29802.1 MBL fold metallo-hydrolase [Carboxydocella sp. ULO1]
MKKEELDAFLRYKTAMAVEASRRFYKLREGRQEKEKSWTLTFLGTGGNPEAVISQQPRTAGFFLQLGDFYFMVDPGPGALYAALELGIDLGQLDAVYISHGHVDHYAGAESIIEGMCWAMSSRRGKLLLPRDMVEENAHISTFHRGEAAHSGYLGGPEVVFLQAYQPIALGELTLIPVPAYHGPENYGFILKAPGLILGYTSDTNFLRSYRTFSGIKEVIPWGPVLDFQEAISWREELVQAYRKVDLLIANVTAHNSWFHRHITTLGLPYLLRESNIKQCYITHFNHCCVWPEDLRPAMAAYVEAVSGVPTSAAYDGLQVDLQRWLKREGEDEAQS